MANELRAAPRIPSLRSATSSQIDALDGLRALAALMVLTTHVAFQTGLVTAPFMGPITSRLDLGVCVFFLLSGFLLYRPWAKAAMVGGSGPRTRQYARKRFARVYPAYLVLVVVVLGWAGDTAPAPLDQWVAYLTMTQIYSDELGVRELTQTWSLATEVAFYALLPVLGYLAGRRRLGDPDASVRWQVGILAAMWSVSLVFHLVRAWTTVLDGWLSYLWLPAFLDWFAAGMLLAVAHARLSVPASGPPARWIGWLRDGARDTTTALVVAVLCFAIVATPLGGSFYFGATGPDTGGPWADLVKHALYAACAFFLLLPLVLGPAEHWYPRAMSSPIMRHLGTVSYGIFLWHLVVLSTLADLFDLALFQGGFLLLWPTTVLATYAVAAISWFLLERPILDWGHGGAGWRRTRGRPAPEPGRR
jgi:peptidoglycan/LPS O-acetylase OafA/YrhL